MKAAFTTWGERIAPVFEVAGQVHLVEVEDGQIAREALEALTGDLPDRRALRLAELGVQTLVCGAISRTAQALVTAYGIRVIPFVAGELREVIQAWLSGQLERDLYAMPGCRRRGGRFRKDANWSQEELMSSTRGRRGQGAGRGGGRGGGAGGQGQGAGRGGQGPGQGQGGGRRGRMGGGSAGGPGGRCVCPQCGHQEPHQRGIPCSRMECPKCGIVLVRQ